MIKLIYILLLLLFPPQFVHISKTIDGDTIDTDLGRVRILGINAPEKGEMCWKEARDALNLSTLTLEKDFVNRDKYGRLLRWSENGKLEKALITKGLVRSYCLFPNYHYCQELWELQINAMENHAGCLWNQSKSCLQITDANKQGEWITVQNKCNKSVELVGIYVQSDGRQKEKLRGTLCSRCNYTVFIHLGKFALLFDKKGFIDYRAT